MVVEAVDAPTAPADGRRTPAPSRTPRSPALVAGVLLLSLAAALVFTRPAPETYDSEIVVHVAEQLVDEGSLRVERDGFRFHTPYAHSGIGISALMAAAYAGARSVGADPVSAAMDVNAVVYALTVVAGLWLARLSGLSPGRSLAVAALVALGTGLLPYVATGFSEPGVALAVALGLVAIQGARLGRPWAPALAGAASGLAVLMRTDSLVLVVPVVAAATWWAAGRTWRAGAGMALAAAPFLVVWGAYNELRYGAPWRLGYGDQPFNHPFWDGVYGLLLSPGRGLFLYVPLAAVALVLMVLGWRRAPLLAAAALALLAVRVLFYAPWWAWNGGACWGPRFLVPAMPGLAVGFVELVRRFRALPGLVRGAVTVLFLLSVGVQVVGAAVGYEHSPFNAALLQEHWNPAEPATHDPDRHQRVNHVIFDWELFPIVDHARMLLRGEGLAGETLQEGVGARLGWLAAVGLAGAGLLVAGLLAHRGAGAATPGTATP